MSIVEELEAAGEVLSPAVRGALVALEGRVHALEEENHTLEVLVQCLEARIGELEAQRRMNSTNSSLPPSADRPGSKRPKKKRSGRKRGGQRGHPGSTRTLLPTERVDEVILHRPELCRRCRHSLAEAPVVGTPGRHQVIELPEVRAHVSEHQTLTLACPHCGGWTRAQLPAEIQGKSFGPRLVAFAAMLIGRFRMSRRNLAAFFSDLLDVPSPALGSTQAFVDEALSALRAPYREAVRAVRRSRGVNVDETGWKLRGVRRVLWVGAAAVATAYRLGRSRSSRDRRALLGRHPPGIVGTDRWKAYDEHPLERRQLCWAHLKRNWAGVAEAGGPGTDIAAEALAFCRTLFAAWTRHTEGGGTHEALRSELLPLLESFRGILERAADCEDKKARALGRDLLRLWPALWTFLEHEGVAVTNNAAEQALRGAVIWRKTSFGSNSGKGLRFTERMLTVIETCRIHERNILDYLTRAIVAHRQNQPAPHLLPVG